MPCESTILDLRAELRAVQSALDTATSRRASIEADIRSTCDIEALAGLHDAWSLAIEQQSAARERRAELQQMLTH